MSGVLGSHQAVSLPPAQGPGVPGNPVIWVEEDRADVRASWVAFLSLSGLVVHGDGDRGPGSAVSQGQRVGVPRSAGGTAVSSCVRQAVVAEESWVEGAGPRPGL